MKVLAWDKVAGRANLLGGPDIAAKSQLCRRACSAFASTRSGSRWDVGIHVGETMNHSSTELDRGSWFGVVLFAVWNWLTGPRY